MARLRSSVSLPGRDETGEYIGVGDPALSDEIGTSAGAATFELAAAVAMMLMVAGVPATAAASVSANAPFGGRPYSDNNKRVLSVSALLDMMCCCAHCAGKWKMRE